MESNKRDAEHHHQGNKTDENVADDVSVERVHLMSFIRIHRSALAFQKQEGKLSVSAGAHLRVRFSASILPQREE